MSDQRLDTPTIWTRLQILLWVMPVVAVVLLPGVVRMVAERPMAARFHLAATMSLIVAIVALVALAIFSRGFRHRIRWSLALTAITMLVLFQWPTLTSAGVTLAVAVNIPLLSDLFPVAAAGAFLWVGTRIGDERGFALVTSVGLWLAIAGLAVGVVPYTTWPAVTARTTVASPGSPDVLLIVVDGYTRGDILETQFDFDNTPFLAGLEDLGFVVADRARPNYSFTYASLATMLNMDYVYDLGPIDQPETTAMRNSLAGEALLMTTFRDHGYEVAFVENAWQGSRCSPLVDVCIRDGLVERASWNLARSTILAPIAPAVRMHPFNTVSTAHLEALPQVVDTDRSDGIPRLTVAHFLIPHPPFFLDESCNRINSPVRRASSTDNEEFRENRRRYYTDQMACTNAMLLDSLGEVLETRDDMLVMITGDHGSVSTDVGSAPIDDWPNGWSDDAVAERMSILSAYRLPGCENKVYPTITPVNGVRALTSCSLNIDLAQLPDWSWWAPGDLDGVVTDESDRLRP